MPLLQHKFLLVLLSSLVVVPSENKGYFVLKLSTCCNSQTSLVIAHSFGYVYWSTRVTFMTGFAAQKFLKSK